MDKNSLYRFFQGTSSREEDRRIVEWLEKDPANETAFNEERKLYNTILTMDECRFFMDDGRAAGFSRRARRLVRSAAVLLPVAAVAGIYFHSRPGRHADMPCNSVDVPVGQHLNINLSDGSAITINGSSTLTWPAVFAGRERRVHLSGEAFFDVARDPKRPFIVETAQCDIEALGTAFNVLTCEDGGKTVASLVSGSIRIVCNDGSHGPVVLSPNEQARFTGDGILVEPIPEYENFQWRNGLIAFRNASFAEMIKMFEKYYGFRIVSDAALSPSVAFSGKIRISDGIDHALWVLQQNAPFGYEKDPESMTITISNVQ